MNELLVGCARVSTEQQDLTAQRNGLHAFGVGDDRIYVDHPATGISPRPQQLGDVVEPLSDPPGDVAAVFTLETRLLTRPVDKAVSR